MNWLSFRLRSLSQWTDSALDCVCQSEAKLSNWHNSWLWLLLLTTATHKFPSQVKCKGRDEAPEILKREDLIERPDCIVLAFDIGNRTDMSYQLSFCILTLFEIKQIMQFRTVSIWPFFQRRPSCPSSFPTPQWTRQQNFWSLKTTIYNFSSVWLKSRP